MSMKLAPLLVIVVAILWPVAAAQGQTLGADAVISDLWGDVLYYGTSFGVSAYAAANTICNHGTQELDWYQPDNRHPVEGTQLYRLKHGRFEQLGLSWAKHNFTAVADDFCGLGCVPPDPYTGETLGVGCSNSTSAEVNGSFGRLGPRGQVDAYTGVFPYHYSQVPYPPRILQAIIGRKLQVHDVDLDPSLNEDARYFLEVQVIAADDAAGDNDFNNVSYREVAVNVPSPGVYELEYVGAVVAGHPAIHAWPLADPSVHVSTVNIPNEGRLIVAAKASATASFNVYDYEYAVYNMTSHRSARAFTIPVADTVTVFEVGFHDVDYHGGDGDPNFPGTFRGDDWLYSRNSGSITWETEPYDSSDPQANAIRWGTLYNFRFRATGAPRTGDLTLDLYRPGTPSSVLVSTLIPGDEVPFSEIPTVSDWGLLLLALLMMTAATLLFRPARLPVR